ncbi:MAG: RnfABCDGE type electron transport complex subunit G [Bacteroidaceae bacterium]|nr:RnfABCDGE type electron transport complex subunit G [Bacteroidaceae bacterium]MBP5322323.1 RnfABCDGE type electron transport complex subunit G [Bacteroidaceae bacterium]
MKRLKSSFKNMVLVLTIISLVAAGLLAIINRVTQGPIDAITAENQALGIKAVLDLEPADSIICTTDTAENGTIIFHVCRADGTSAGTAVEAADGQGFGGEIKVLVGFAENGDIKGYQVMQHSETPGLGARANEWFRTATSANTKEVSPVSKLFFGNPDPAGSHNIIGMNPGKSNFTVSKDGGEVDAITASTITSRAFLRTVQNAYYAFMGSTAADAVSGATTQADEGDASTEVVNE